MKLIVKDTLLDNDEKHIKWLLYTALVFIALTLIGGVILALDNGALGFHVYGIYLWYNDISTFIGYILLGWFDVTMTIGLVMFYFGAAVAAICMLAYLRNKRISLVTILSSFLYGSAIYFLPLYSDFYYWKKFPIRAPVSLVLSIIAVLIATALLIVWIVSRFKQKKHTDAFKLGRALLSDCALFLIWLIAAIPICDILHLTFNMILNLIV